jgi:hypothetical protein
MGSSVTNAFLYAAAAQGRSRNRCTWNGRQSRGAESASVHEAD